MTKRLYASLLMIAVLAGCGGGGSDTATTETPPTTTPPTSSSHVGYYPAANGTGYSNLYDLVMPTDGYLDITKFKASVALLSQDLTLLNSDISSNDQIGKGNYKVRITYEPTSLLPGNVTVFSLSLTDYKDIPSIQSKQYNANGQLGTYAEYYKLALPTGGNISISTSKATVEAYNYTQYGTLNQPLASHYIKLNDTHSLDPGEYIIKITYQATSLTPGNVSFFYAAK